MKKYILLIVALLSSVSTWAYVTYKTDTITYRIYDTYATVYQDSSSVKKLSGEVAIPATVTYNEVDYNVTKVDRWYYGNEVDLVLPNSIVTAANISWANVGKLTSLKLPENASFTSFSLSNIRNIIGELIIPKTITSITLPTNSSYGGSWNLTSFKVDADNPNYKSEGGVLFTKDGSCLVSYPYKKEGVAYTVPAGVTSIGDYAFYNDDNIETIIIPSGVTTIGKHAFDDCSYLYKCEMPTTITSIGDYAFYYCKKLSVCDITSLTALLNIGQCAFYSCRINVSNNTFTLPANVKTIGSNAFVDAFENNFNVTVEFPTSLGESGSQVKLDGYVFNCYTVRSYMTDPVNCNTYEAFYTVSRIYIPAGTKDIYKAKTGWGYDETKLVESASLDYDSNLADPTITPILDATNSLVSVKLSSASTTDGATILYRIFTSGSADIDVSDWYTYNGTDVFPMDNYSTIKAITTKGGKFSHVSQYTVDLSSLKCPTPDIISAVNSTTMTMATTLAGATIYYTIDNSTPSASNGTKYTGQITLAGNYTYKAVAVMDGKFTSDVQVYSVNWFKCKTPTATYAAATPDGNNVIVTLTSDEEGVTLKYRPQDSNEFLTYTGPVTTSMNSDFYYMATKTSYNDSDVPYIFTNRNSITCDKPGITPDQSTKLLTLTAPEGVNIYYSLDGVDPVVSEDFKYSGTPITITGNCTVKAIAHKAGWFQSDQANTNINNWFTCPDVVIEQVYENGAIKMRLGLADSTSVDVKDMNIYYLINDYYTYEDGWKSNANVYSEPVLVNNGSSIYAVAIKDGYIMSGRSSKSIDFTGYTQCSQPSISLDNENKTITITTSEMNGKIYYTLDGKDPDTSSTLYTAPFTSDKNCVVKAITTRDPETVDDVTTYYTASYVDVRSLDDWFRVSDVIFIPILGEAEGEYKLALKGEEGATVYYGINQGANAVYSDTLVVAAGDWVYALARKTGLIDSYERSIRIEEGSYQVRTPDVNLNDVTRQIIVKPNTYESVIYYTYDGSTPDPASETTIKMEKDTIDVERNGNYKFIAVKDHMTNSSVVSYNIDWLRVPAVVITPFAEDNVLKVKLECEDSQAQIYYATSSDYSSDDVTSNARYTEPFEITDGARVWASAVRDGYTNASWVNSSWIYTSSYTCATPTITIAADTLVSITSTDEGAKLYYTLDGSDPTTSSTEFTSKFKMTTNGTIKAIAAVAGKLNSNIRSRDYSGYSVQSVTITPIVENNTLKIKLETTTPGADIYYNINERNDENIKSNMRYTGPFAIPNDSYIYAIAIKDGYTNSSWNSSGWYYFSNYTSSTPTITINADTTCIITAGEDATIYYTMNGDDPTTSSAVYEHGTTGFKLTSNVTVKAIAVQSGKMTSNVRERSYNGFYVASPQFSVDGIKMTITSTTPGVTINYCYEPDPRDEYGNLMYTRTYTGAFDLLYNGSVYVRATKDGYNSTENSYWQSGLVKWQKPEVLSNNGHALKFKDIEGATIWYTTNGDYPGPGNYSSVEYKDSVLLTGTGTIRAIAQGNYRNDSEVAEISINSYAGLNGATSEKAGGLATSMGWATPSTITEFTVTGPINGDDIKFIKDKMTSLQHLDLSAATIDDGIIPDKAFADMPLLEFSSPNGLQSIGDNIFAGCDNLAAVVWNTTAKIPDNAFDADVNPNLLLFVPSEEAAPTNSYAQNIIVNGTAKNIYLSDGEGNNFHCPQGFYAQNITYTHNFKLESGEGYGWETIALPFECSRFIHESKGELLPFSAYDSLTEKAQYKPFWLRELTDVGFKDVSRIEPNKPYIICMPNNDGYASRYRLGGKVTFTSTETWVPVTEPQAVQKGVNTLYANFLNNDNTDDIMLLNTVETDGKKAGSIFVKSSGRSLRPFEAYVISRANARAYVSLTRGFTDDPDGDDDATPIETISTQSSGKMVKVYSLSGVLVREAAEEDALKGLAKGVYIVNGKSMIVK